jgi:hypothetical protein
MQIKEMASIDRLSGALRILRLFIYLKTDNAAAGNTGQKTATNVYPVKNKQSYIQY